MIFNGHSTEEERGRKADGLGYGKDRIRLPRCRQPEEGPGAQAHPSAGKSALFSDAIINRTHKYIIIKMLFALYFLYRVASATDVS